MNATSEANEKAFGIARRNIHDSVFTNLFGDPEYTLQLYQALHPEDDTATTADLQIVTLENILLSQPYNDLGFIMKDKLLVLVEAQSTWSDNIVIRSLIYAAQTIQEYISKSGQRVYSTGKIRIPEPELYVLYTGDKKDPPDLVSLSKDFFGGKPLALDVNVKVLRNGREGDIIYQYVLFTKVWNEQRQIYGTTQEAILATIRICKDRNILKAYLESREKEVIDIMITLYSQARAVDEYGEEREKKGMNLISKLMDLLFEQNRIDEARKVAKDSALRDRLLKEFQLV